MKVLRELFSKSSLNGLRAEPLWGVGQSPAILFIKILDKLIFLCYIDRVVCGPVVQLVRTLACHARGRRFEPVPGRFIDFVTFVVYPHARAWDFADIAQQVEHFLGKEEVDGSSPFISLLKVPSTSCFLLVGLFFIGKYLSEDTF